MRPPVLRRGLAVLLLLMIGVHQGWRHWGEPYLTQSLTLYWQDKCLTYSLPPDRVAFVAAPKGLQLPSYLADFSLPPNTMWNGTLGAPPYPIELAELQKHQLAGPVTLEALPSPVFLHGLNDPSGRQKLVMVYVTANNPAGWWTIAGTSMVPISPGTSRRLSNPVVSTASWLLTNYEAATLVVFAGQADRKDPSKFTLRVRLNGHIQEVTGKLQNDGHIIFSSSSGFAPWEIDRIGPLLRPTPMVTPSPNGIFDGERWLLPTD